MVVVVAVATVWVAVVVVGGTLDSSNSIPTHSGTVEKHRHHEYRGKDTVMIMIVEKQSKLIKTTITFDAQWV